MEPPTRRIDPVAPPAGVVQEQVVVDDLAWRQDLLDRLNGLRTGLVLVGLLSAIALGVGLYALLSDEDTSAGDGRRGASSARVTRLDSRVDRLETQVDGRATKGEVDSVRNDIQSLDAKVAKTQATAQDNGDTANLQSAIEDQTQAIEDLQKRVDSLEQSQNDAGDTTQTP